MLTTLRARSSPLYQLLGDLHPFEFEVPDHFPIRESVLAIRASLKGRRLRQGEYVRLKAKSVGGTLLVTPIDNYDFLGRISAVKNGIRTIAIQNGTRTADDWNRAASSLARDEPLHDVFLCWGRNDVKNLEDLGIRATSVIPIGSLKDSLHRERGHSADQSREISAVFIKSALVTGQSTRGAEIQILPNLKLLRYLDKYSSMRGVRIRYVPYYDSKAGYEEVRSFLGKNLSSTFELSVGQRGWSTSYDEVMSSHVVVGSNSSMLVEAFGRGKRILAVNMSQFAWRDFPVSGVWSLRLPTFDEFAERLDLIRNMSEAMWKQQVADLPSWLVAYDTNNPTHVVVNRTIRKLLREVDAISIS